jgi:DNA-3-methyladenine glycosylase
VGETNQQHETRLKLAPSFYRRDDVVEISRELLGKILCTKIDGHLTKAIITETEAYAGITDKASHAYGDRRTGRTEPLYADGGIAYVYLCYGIHHLFNVVTNVAGTPHAVLVRAGSPIAGVDQMLARRSKELPDEKLLAGPGSLARALGITTKDTGISLFGDRVWIENARHEITDDCIVAGPRRGIDYAGEDAARPYRFIMSADH